MSHVMSGPNNFRYNVVGWYSFPVMAYHLFLSNNFVMKTNMLNLSFLSENLDFLEFKTQLIWENKYVIRAVI